MKINERKQSIDSNLKLLAMRAQLMTRGERGILLGDNVIKG